MDWLALHRNVPTVLTSQSCLGRASVLWGYDMMALLADAFPGVRNFLDASSFLFTGGAERENMWVRFMGSSVKAESVLEDQWMSQDMPFAKCNISKIRPQHPDSPILPNWLGPKSIQKNHQLRISESIQDVTAWFRLERWWGLEWVMVPPSAVAWNPEMPATK